MKIRHLVLGLMFCGMFSVADGRTIRLTLWVSGGLNGILLGGDPAPGWLGVSEHIRRQSGEAAWVDFGGISKRDCLSSIPDLRFPDAVVPGESFLRLQGADALDEYFPWTLLNVSILPQFPGVDVPVPPSQVWRQADELGWRILALLSDKAPLRVPPRQLRPLWITDPLEALRSHLLDHPEENMSVTALVLPEGGDPAEWSRRVPDIPVLIEPAGTYPEIIEVHGGNQIRVRPARFGRAVIRVWMNWDTVERRFGNPKAEVEWVRTPNLEALRLPACAVDRLRPLVDPPVVNPGKALKSKADVVLTPASEGTAAESTLIDALRVAAVAEDHAWLRVETTSTVLSNWMKLRLPGFEWRGRLETSGPLTVLLPDVVAAGAGGAAWPIREALDNAYPESEWMEFTTRDLVVPLPEAGE